MLTFIVPFRCTDQPERAYQLQLFLHTIQSFIPGASIIVSEQSDQAPFNRGGLLNAGVAMCAVEDDSVLCFHDLNVLPTVESIHEYVRPLPPKTVRHVRASGSHSRLGHIVFIRYRDFQDINGFPNGCWGYRGENEQLHLRILRHGMRIERVEAFLLDLNRLHDMKRQEDKQCKTIQVEEDGLSHFDKEGCSVVACKPPFMHMKVHIKYRIPPA